MQKYQEGWKKFIKLCLKMENAEAFSHLFDLFLTSDEKENLAMRYLIINELIQQKKTQREIASDLGVSIAKITRGSNELKRLKKEYLQQLKILFQKP